MRYYLTRMATFAIALVLCGAALLMFSATAGAPVPTSGTWATPTMPRTGPTNPGPVRPVTEDMPQWDCRTMGNRVCGTPVACKRYQGATRTACAALWHMPERVTRGDGWETVTPHGPALVRECQADNRADGALRACFQAWL